MRLCKMFDIVWHGAGRRNMQPKCMSKNKHAGRTMQDGMFQGMPNTLHSLISHRRAKYAGRYTRVKICRPKYASQNRCAGQNMQFERCKPKSASQHRCRPVCAGQNVQAEMCKSKYMCRSKCVLAMVQGEYRSMHRCRCASRNVQGEMCKAT